MYKADYAVLKLLYITVSHVPPTQRVQHSSPMNFPTHWMFMIDVHVETVGVVVVFAAFAGGRPLAGSERFSGVRLHSPGA